MSETISDYADDIARRNGQYARAAALNMMVEHLDGLDRFIANYDPTRE